LPFRTGNVAAAAAVFSLIFRVVGGDMK